ncbi:hypothetical protein [Amycolatopsis sp. cmx-4-61]|uniref:hypothetical protein n=1 Tax=Amycolatopsis sp. cmx-4-61 TaxID=2790937 RepID=UPI00397B4B71
MSGHITASVAAALLGVATADSANRTLRRWGVDAVGRQPGRGGENLYAEAAVRAAVADRPRRGRPAAAPVGETLTLSFEDGPVEVDLQRLTPVARALAEVMAAQPLSEMARCDVVLQSRLPLRELVPERQRPLLADAPDQPDIRVYRGFSPWRRDQHDIHRWLEYEASKLGGYIPVRPAHSRDSTWRAPSAEAALRAPDELLRRDDAIAHLRRCGRPMGIEAWFAGQRAGTIPGPAEYTDDGPRWSKVALTASASAVQEGPQ